MGFISVPWVLVLKGHHFLNSYGSLASDTRIICYIASGLKWLAVHNFDQQHKTKCKVNMNLLRIFPSKILTISPWGTNMLSKTELSAKERTKAIGVHWLTYFIAKNEKYLVGRSIIPSRAHVRHILLPKLCKFNNRPKRKNTVENL